jgi:hypothetical protein
VPLTKGLSTRPDFFKRYRGVPMSRGDNDKKVKRKFSPRIYFKIIPFFRPSQTFWLVGQGTRFFCSPPPIAIDIDIDKCPNALPWGPGGGGGLWGGPWGTLAFKVSWSHTWEGLKQRHTFGHLWVLFTSAIVLLPLGPTARRHAPAFGRGPPPRTRATRWSRCA